MKSLLTILLFLLFLSDVKCEDYSLDISTQISDELKSSFKNNGRIFLFISKSRGREPRLNTWPGKSNMILAINLENWQGEKIEMNDSLEFIKSTDISLKNIPAGKYSIQILWDQDRMESRMNAPGNLYSEVETIDLTHNQNIHIPITKEIGPRKLAEHELLKEIDIKSEILSDWWEKEIRLKAAVFLPREFTENSTKKYPVRYNVAGYGGRYTRAERMLRDLDWWLSDEAPEVINVFLDGEGPFGDSYQLNSENSGPYGTALIEELIPYIEKEFRAIGTPETRFVEGCSTGGWVSLALQLIYPDFFGGCFSYSPDPVDFHHFQLIDIYEDENAYMNEYDFIRPLARNVTGEPVISFKDFVQYENVQGWSDSYVTSGGQFSAFTALFSPKGEDGLPVPLFDPVTGEIDRDVAEHWKKYDLKLLTDSSWESLGPKIAGKIWIWGADMDNFYLNPALRSFEKMLQQKKNPKADAVITFTPMTGHCQEYNNKKVLMQIQSKLKAND